MPTLSEAVGPGFEMSTWSALLAPAGTPAEITARLNSEINRILVNPAVVKQISPDGELTLLGGPPERVTATLKSEFALWGKLVREETSSSIENWRHPKYETHRLPVRRARVRLHAHLSPRDGAGAVRASARRLPQ